MELENIWAKLLKYATLRYRSEKEIGDWFKRKKVGKEIQKELTGKLGELDLLGDERFAAWWIDQRVTFRPRSKKELYFELLKKGIAKAIIKEAIEKAKIDEVKVAKKLLSSKKYREKEKIAGYLSRKGFSWSVISRVIDQKSDT